MAPLPQILPQALPEARPSCLLHIIIENDRYPVSPRILTLKAILAKIRPEPVRKPVPPLQHYEPPSKGRYRRRG
jgi:hypothetical protein